MCGISRVAACATKNVLSIVSYGVNVAKNATFLTGTVATAILTIDSFVFLRGSQDQSRLHQLNVCNASLPTILNFGLTINYFQGHSLDCEKDYTLKTDHIQSVVNMQAFALPVVVIGSTFLYRTLSKIENNINSAIAGL